ncbi:four helix bundle protein [Halomonas beimenensis]|uniref:dTDP-4-amino-4,6-dideoxygalactose transaminase n=1 Tax=Halomonas beimenensis TaxID=475662 RepID=A0A291P6Y6_9GAMM|nr:four helix bundle protein [Halomonas beimenensis]ATJ82654.1 dTDP-4-amino-4,6-dideoxygalactose transaminase [Halomonas beimenensis]
MKFEDLLVWKRSARLCAEVFQAFSQSREFGFKDQITRSALSIASNIAEGYERDSDRDRVKFLSYAKGSCAELRAQIYIGMEIGYISRTVGQRWAAETREISKMLYALMSKMRR